MKALILTGSFGMGHNSCAHAVAAQLKEHYGDITIKSVDIWKYILPIFDKVLYSSFNVLANRHYSLYNSLKVVAENQSRFPFEDIVSRKMRKLMNEVKPDVVISTLSVSSKIMSNYKGRYGDKTPLITCITDIRIHKEWVGENTDYYCVGSNALRPVLQGMGVPDDKICVTGIPVSPEFYPSEHEPNLSGKINVLVMGGGLGLLPDANLLLPLLNDDEKLSVTVICGKNTALYEEIAMKYKNINAVGFTPNVAEYMRMAHVLLSKPGGITTFEAINSALPMLVINPFLAQETANADFIENHKIGVVARGNARAYTQLKSVLHNINDLQTMRQNMLIMRKNTETVGICAIIDMIFAEKVVA